MKRTQIYLTLEQQDILENMAFITSKKEHKKITISAMIRQAIDYFIENNKALENETDIILKSSLLQTGLNEARKQKELLDHKDVFG